VYCREEQVAVKKFESASKRMEEKKKKKKKKEEKKRHLKDMKKPRQPRGPQIR